MFLFYSLFSFFCHFALQHAVIKNRDAKKIIFHVASYVYLLYFYSSYYQWTTGQIKCVEPDYLLWGWIFGYYIEDLMHVKEKGMLLHHALTIILMGAYLIDTETRDLFFENGLVILLYYNSIGNVINILAKLFYQANFRKLNITFQLITVIFWQVRSCIFGVILYDMCRMIYSYDNMYTAKCLMFMVFLVWFINVLYAYLLTRKLCETARACAAIKTEKHVV